MHLQESSSHLTKITEDVLVDQRKVIGQGSFGKVFQGFHEQKKQIIAVKFISHSTMKGRQDQFLRQTIILKNLTNLQHPNILEFYGYEKNQKGLYMFFQFCNGGDLSKHIENGFGQDKAISIFSQILEGMTFMAKQNILHRDLKPKNIFLTEYGQVKIGDLGSARQYSEYMTVGSQRCSPLYAPPQFLLDSNKVYDERCDVWSLGLVFYECLVGKHLFFIMEKKNYQSFYVEDLKKAIKKLRDNYEIKIEGKLKKEWTKIIRQMLIFDYHKRPTFQQVKKKFESLRISIQSIYKKDLSETQKDEFLMISNNLRKDVNPFDSQNVKKEEGKKSTYEKQEQKGSSYNLFNKVIQYITFTNQKNKVILLLNDRFHRKKYDLLQNVHKWEMMFLTNSISYLRNQEFLKNIKEMQFKIKKDQIINIHSFTKEMQKPYEDLILEAKRDKQKTIQREKKILQKILNKILVVYMERENERKILNENKNLVKLMQDAKLKKFSKQRAYFEEYRKLFEEQVSIQKPQLYSLSWQELKTYAMLLLIMKIDKKFSFNNNHNNDFIKKEIERIDCISIQQTMNSILQLI